MLHLLFFADIQIEFSIIELKNSLNSITSAIFANSYCWMDPFQNDKLQQK